MNTIALMNEKWLDSLRADLRKIVRDNAAATSCGTVPLVNEFFAAQRKDWTDKGGRFIELPADEEAAFLVKTSTIGGDLSGIGEFNRAVKVVMQTAARAK